jgi:hypothetical protein
MEKSNEDEWRKNFEDFVRKSVLVILNSRIDIEKEEDSYKSYKVNKQVLYI